MEMFPFSWTQSHVHALHPCVGHLLNRCACQSFHQYVQHEGQQYIPPADTDVESNTMCSLQYNEDVMIYPYDLASTRRQKPHTEVTGVDLGRGYAPPTTQQMGHAGTQHQ